jgi:hypothetical protein
MYYNRNYISKQIEQKNRFLLQGRHKVKNYKKRQIKKVLLGQWAMGNGQCKTCNAQGERV